MTFRTVKTWERPKGGAFEPATLPLTEKESLCRTLLEEFGLRVSSHAKFRQELIIPCDLGDHRNQDREPTGALNYKKLTFKCLGCQRSGGLLWFIAEHRGTTSTDARKWLGKETGTDGRAQDLSSLLRYFDALYGEKAKRAPMPVYSEKILDPWMLIHPWLTDPPEFDERGRNVGGRGIPEENLDRFQVGYAEQFKYSMRPDKTWITSERIVIPHFWQGDLVGWQTRRLDGSDGTAKYKSSTDFPKDSTIFNYDPDSHSTAVVVESPASVLRHAHHVHIVATFGADITERQVKLLGRYDRLIFWMDNDRAGWSTYQGIYDRRGKQTKPGVLEQASRYTGVWAVDSNLAADPADLDDATVDRLVASAIPGVVWDIPKTLKCFRCGQDDHGGGC